MKTLRIVIRTFLDTVLLLAFMRVQVNSIISGHVSNDNKLHRNKYSNSNDSRDYAVVSNSDDPVRGHGSNEWAHLQNYSRSFVTESRMLGIKRALNPEIPVNSHGNGATTSVTLSTLSTSLPSTTSSNYDTVRSVPYTYFKVMNSYLHKGLTSQRQNIHAPKLQIIIGVLLPFDGIRPFVATKVSPAIEQAVDKVASAMGPWNFYSLTVLYADSMCDIAEAMNQAIQFEERLKTSAFFGPVCDYAIAPVARQARFWNTPIITAGATALDFYLYKNTTYSTLTRVGPANLQGCVEFIETIIALHHWVKVKTLYSSTGQDDNLFAFSHLLTEYLHYHMKSIYPKITMDIYQLDSRVSADFDHVLRQQVSTDYSGSRSDTALTINHTISLASRM